MPLELNQIRFALDEFDRATDDAGRDEARRKLLALLTVGLIRTLLATIDDLHRRLADCEDARD